MIRASHPAALLPRRLVPAVITVLALGIHAAANSRAQPSAPAPVTLTDEQTQAMVKRVLHTELEAAANAASTHPMQYRLRKVSPRLSTTKIIAETKDGDVARLVAVNDAPLSPVDQQNEDTRLESLLKDPGLQRHRKEREQGDSDRARKIINALPDAFLYQFAGIVETPQGPSYRLSFQPNPNFNPQDLEAQVLKAMAGELWIDVADQRVTRLEGKRLRDVEYGWSILGKLDKGGTLRLEQANVGNHQWRTTHMVLAMNARVLFKPIKLDTTLELSQFTPLAPGMNYQQAIQMLRTNPSTTSQAR